MRLLSRDELNNLAVLTESGVDFGLIELTATGLSKSILDATIGLREFLERNALHDYSLQPQGPDFKKTMPALIWAGSEEIVQSRASLYRPQTKKGDPRIWFSELSKYAKPGVVVAVFWDGRNLNLIDVSSSITNSSKLGFLLMQLGAKRSTARAELRALLEDLAERGWIRARKSGTTAVGHLLETELGIQQNSSRNPDFRGIEIKSSSKTRTSDNRYTLFAKVATWPLSNLKSSAEILSHFGYFRDGSERLYCTVDARKPNSQGLQFRFDETNRNLIEFAASFDVATWEESALIYSLEQKHRETFWVKADKKEIGGHLHFRYRSVVNTKNPISSQFIPLVQEGVITMDHLIKRKDSSVSEKGPLFKIRSDSLDLLFPSPSIFNLSDDK